MWLSPYMGLGLTEWCPFLVELRRALRAGSRDIAARRVQLQLVLNLVSRSRLRQLLAFILPLNRHIESLLRLMSLKLGEKLRFRIQKLVMSDGLAGLLLLVSWELGYFEERLEFLRLHSGIFIIGAGSLRHLRPPRSPLVFVLFVVFYYHLTTLLFDLIEEFLGVTPNLGTWPGLDKFLNLLPVLAIDS